MIRVNNTTRGLPAEYQEVEYIENNGTCYINTGLSIKDGYRSVQKLRFLAYQTSEGGYVTGGYLGYDSGMGNHARLYVGNGQSGTTGWSYGYWGSFTNGTTATATIGTDYDMDYSWISGNAFLKIDGTSYFSSSSTYTTSLSGPVSVFAGYAPNSPVVHPGLRVYSAKYYDSTDTLVRDLVPCYRKADDEIGMYDLVNDTFYTNSGTGTFTKGSDVPDMVEKQVRPDNRWKPGANTIAYFPFKEDQLDHSGNGHTFNNSLTKEPIGYSITQASGNTGATNSTFIGFVGCWYNITSINSSAVAGILGTANLGATVYYAGSNNSSIRNKIQTYTGSGFTVVGNTDGMSYNARHYIAFSLYNGVLYVCKDGVVTTQYNGTPYDYGGRDIGLLQVGSGASISVTFSQYILEDTGWAPQAMTDYYNSTKSNYGL